MDESIPIDDKVFGTYYKTHEIVLCDVCKGLGQLARNDKYAIAEHYSCYNCKGDGRMIKIHQEISLHPMHTKEKTSYISYIANVDHVRTPLNETHEFSMKRDFRDIALEAKYPDLAALTYTKYDELLEKYQLIEILKKDESK